MSNKTNEVVLALQGFDNDFWEFTTINQSLTYSDLSMLTTVPTQINLLLKLQLINKNNLTGGESYPGRFADVYFLDQYDPSHYKFLLRGLDYLFAGIFLPLWLKIKLRAFTISSVLWIRNGFLTGSLQPHVSFVFSDYQPARHY